MRKLIFFGALVLVAVVPFTGCSSKGKIEVDVAAPTVLRSIDDMPKPSISMEEIRKTGLIRVIGESARNQEQFNALTAAKGVAQRNALAVVRGTRIDSETMIQNGTLDKDEVKLLVEGHIKTYDCGAYYDQVLRAAYYCVEVPVK